MSFEIYKNLAWLNDMPHAEAESVFRDCCGSTVWASRMAECRPFAMLENLYAAAEDIWFSLSPADHLEAFAAHPQIGSKHRAPSQKKQAADWSASEQSGVSGAAGNILDQLADANRLYKKKFGFIFIVFASGKTADEMLAICRARQGNSVETELKIAAQEQHKITETRLNKLLEK